MNKPDKAVRRFHPECVDCLLNKALAVAQLVEEDGLRLEYIQKLKQILENAEDWESAPLVLAKINRLQKELLNYEADFEREKDYFNRLMMSKEAFIEEQIHSSADPLHTALNFALLGNYIDFGAMDKVDTDELDRLLHGAVDLEYNDGEYANLVKDLSTAKRLVYLTDNCGEIVADKLFIKEILRQFPSVKAEVIVKGHPVLNDATLKDAEQIGLGGVVPFSHNGSRIVGTCLDDISAEATEKINSADVIISKGQANFETLIDSGKNIYFIFMCKCMVFAGRFGVDRFSGMLLNELRK